jgi:D-alanyl-D-alanine carboxypeptidase
MFSFRHAMAALIVAALSFTSAQAAGEQALLEQVRLATGAPGLAAAVITSDRIDVFADGRRRADRDGAVTPADSFHVGSDMKAMVATLIAREIEAGRLRWDSQVVEILPDVAIFARREYWGVTITQLLQHRAGVFPLLTLDDVATAPKFKGSVVQKRLQFARWVLRKKPTSKPGTTTSYSNAGYIVAAAMLERVTGKSTETLLEQQLFAPLGIRTAHFDWPAAGRLGSQPWGHAATDVGFVAVSPLDPATRAPAWANPAGNLSLSTGDFARFVQLHLRGLRGTSNYLAPQTFARLHTPVDGYACGWAIQVVEGAATISHHAGGTDLFYAVMVVVPDLDRAAVVVVNAETTAIHDAAYELAGQLIIAE